MILPLWFEAAAVAVCPGLVGVDSPTDRDRLARPLAPNAADPRAVVPTAYFKKRKDSLKSNKLAKLYSTSELRVSVGLTTQLMPNL